MFSQKNFERVKKLTFSNYHIIILVYIVSLLLQITSLAYSLISDTLTKCLLTIPFSILVGTIIISIYFLYFISEKDIKPPDQTQYTITREDVDFQ
jgi:hypothetical protein